MSDCVLHQGVTVLAYLALSYLIIKQLYKLLKSFRVHILSRVWRTNLKKYGGWAVVTGATDGIGKGYAHELAKRGLNVVLISRTLEKLQKVAKEIVNNVGMTHHPEAGDFLDAPGDLNKGIINMLNCNVLSMLQMIRIVLPKMVQRKKGIIINISSEAGTRPFSKVSLYSATKVFMDYFSRSLNLDYKSKGIIVQSVMPLLVSTNMTKNIKSNLFVKTADDFAREALNTVGLTHRTSGCLSHSFQSYVVDLLLTDFIVNSQITAGIIDLIYRAMAKLQKVD